ncbi:unnamed protein product [Phytophthora lilii]|uniref:Unnamed protein product n=1 Tax=Phytophthora lilii TaxID=2077276 RepID=A0A9W6UCM2_9STRA|nr:unnamed protein product [Phytophthora lilii]
MNAGERRYVRASDRRLVEMAAQSAARIDLETLRHRRSQAAGVTTERSFDGTVVTATCVIECSLAEMKALLAPPTNEHYACVMRELVGQDFIYGAIVHHAEEISTQDVTVRTATFVKRHLLARNEQWCFVSDVKTLEPISSHDDKGFTVTLASLHPDDVFTGKAQAASVIHLQGLSAVYLVTAEEHRKLQNGRTRRAVRVTFCAHVTTSPGSGKTSRLRWLLPTARNREEANDASNGAVLARVVQLARSLKQFQVAVRRRRLDAQVLADLRKVQPTNSRCACCTRRVSAIQKLFGSSSKEESSSRGGAKQCHLCGFLVCARCVCKINKNSLSDEMSSVSSKSTRYNRTVYLCEHCMQRVDDADYDNFCASSDGLSPLSGPVQPDGPDTEPASAAIARALSQVLGDASQEEKPVVIRVIKHLLSPREQKAGKFRADPAELAKSLGLLAEKEGFSQEMPASPEANQEQAPEVTPEDPSSPQQINSPPLAGVTGRQYALQYADVCEEDDGEDAGEDAEDDAGDNAGNCGKPDDSEDVVRIAHHPVPADEASRLQWIDTHTNVISRMMNLPDLELLCNVARGELKCDATMVTIFDPNTCYVVACTDPSWRGFELPRDHAICGHTLMGDAPLLVRHPEADVRFSSMDVVRRSGLRFYFGFPIRISYPEGGGTTAIGTFCCVHTGGAIDVSESQYAIMATLAEGATRVLECRASRLIEG